MKKIIQNQKGIALVIVILLLVALTTLGVMAVNVSNVGTKITSNTKTTKQAFYLAEAGIESARELLRTQLVAGSSLATQLTAAMGGNGVLTDSSNIMNFSTTDDTPLINTTNLGSGSFRVFLTNDTAEGVTSTADSNGIVTLTAFGNGPDNSVAVIQVTAIKNGGINLPNLPGAITLSGPTTTFQKGNSNASGVGGGAHPAVAVNAAAPLTTVVNDINGTTPGSGPDRSGNWTGTGGSPSVQNLTFGSPWDSISDLQKLYTQMKSNAHYTSTSDDGFTYGTSANQKIIVIDGNLTIGPGSGAGILIVTGNLSIHGNFDYNGVVLAIGSGNITRYGGGNGTISGGIFVANINGADGQINTADDAFGATNYDTNGGGTSDIIYNSNTYSSSVSGNVINTIPFAKTSWKQF